MYIIIAIIIFGILITIHELGHFIAAKSVGVRVDEFSIGMGPAIFKKQRGETLYALRVLPIGGYCAMAGEDEASDDPRAFTNKGFLPRLLILCAGSAMNFLLGMVVIFTMSFMMHTVITPVIGEFMEGCPYESEELFQTGDRFYRVDGERIRTNGDLNNAFAKGDGVYDLVMVRDGKKVELEDVELTLREYPGYEGKKFGFIFTREEMNLSLRLSYTATQTGEFSRWVWLSLEELVHGKVKLDDMSGPVGIIDLMNTAGSGADSAADAAFTLMYLSAFIAINLAIMNMLPIPAMDGGRVFFLVVTLIIETVTGKKPDPKYEGYINAAGLILLLGLMLLLLFNDTAKIIAR